MMRGLAWTAVLAAAAAACERREEVEDESAPILTLRVETPEPLDWGGTGILRLTLSNEGDVAAEGGIVEVHVPDWLEFGTVEPPGTEVMVLSGDAETRLSYRLTDSIAPGDSRVVEQQLRVRPRPVGPPVQDTVETVQLPPANQTVRARLLDIAGDPLGVEVQATLHFVGWSGTIPPDSMRDTTAVPRDSVRTPTDTTPLPPRDTTPPR
jgi:hypothetical protein